MKHLVILVEDKISLCSVEISSMVEEDDFIRTVEIDPNDDSICPKCLELSLPKH